jgi:hypothetical protein
MNMTSPSIPDQPGNTLGLLRDIEKLKHQPVSGAPLDPKLALLRNWQSQRLARTYGDLLADPRYRPACEFFLDDIYAARDFSQRDHDIEQMYDFMQRVLPASMIHPLKLTVEVHALTNALDARLLDVLVNQLGITDSIAEEQYAKAYRRCDNYVVRAQQIDLIHKIGSELDGIVQWPMTGAALAVAKGPARRAGWVELTDFIERGYRRSHMHGAEYFLKTVRQREKLILDRIYSLEPNPFAI